MGNLKFNGTSTVDLGVVIQTPPTYEFPSRDVYITHIPGKTGDVVIDNNSYQNIKRSYYLASGFRKNTSFVENAKRIIEWLTSAQGNYARLEDSYEPDYYRLALFRDEGQLSNLFDQATALQITFECKPQRYIKKGEIPLEIQAQADWYRIDNPYSFIALPELIINSMNVTIEMRYGEDVNNPKQIPQRLILENAMEPILIDSELQECYGLSGYHNNLVTLTNGFLKLYPGVNWIKIISSSNNQSVLLKPRWWTL